LKKDLQKKKKEKRAWRKILMDKLKKKESEEKYEKQNKDNEMLQ
jgi:hypothetical protein